MTVPSSLLDTDTASRLRVAVGLGTRFWRIDAAGLPPAGNSLAPYPRPDPEDCVTCCEDCGCHERALVDEVERLAAELPDPAEMERAITGLEARHLFELQKVNERADQISMLTTYFDAPELVATELERYRAVTGEEVRRVTAELLTADNRAVLTYLPDG